MTVVSQCYNFYLQNWNLTKCFRGGKDREGEMRYNPFRVTPYLLKVQGTGMSGEEEEPCSLALAERMISGYEGIIIISHGIVDILFHAYTCKLDLLLYSCLR